MKLNIQKFAGEMGSTVTGGKIIDEPVLKEYHNKMRTFIDNATCDKLEHKLLTGTIDIGSLEYGCIYFLTATSQPITIKYGYDDDKTFSFDGIGSLFITNLTTMVGTLKQFIIITTGKIYTGAYNSTTYNEYDLSKINYELPIATSTTLGGVKVGAGLSINNGVLSATGGGTADSVDWSNVQNRPTKLSDFTNDSGFTTNTGTITGIKMNGASKGTSGVVDLGTVITAHQDISGKQDKITSTNKLAYSLISGTPTIPTVNNATLTIQKNGTNVQTFTANQSTNATANITVPTKTSELTNDSNFLTQHQDISGKQDKITTSNKLNYSLISGVPITTISWISGLDWS